MHFVAKKPKRNGYRHKNVKNGGEVETPRRMHEMRKFERKEAYRKDDDEVNFEKNPKARGDSDKVLFDTSHATQNAPKSP